MLISDVSYSAMQSVIASSAQASSPYSPDVLAGASGPSIQTASVQFTATTNIVIVQQGGGGGVLPEGIGSLLRSLAANDFDGSQVALHNLRSSPHVSQGPLGLGLGSLLAQLSSTLEGGNPGHALSKIHDFLLDAGRPTGNMFDATA